MVKNVKLQFKEDVTKEVLYRLIDLHLIKSKQIAHTTANIKIKETSEPNTFEVDCADDESLFITGEALHSLSKKIVK